MHERGVKCTHAPKAPTKQLNNIVRFRNSSAWKSKRAEIKQRDGFLCQLCKLDNRYTYEGLDVHHIAPISRAWAERLEGYNLITLCKHHHFLADNNEIERAYLYKITNVLESVYFSAELKM
jgi:5-methylcytosine-specific restriction protein A